MHILLQDVVQEAVKEDDLVMLVVGVPLHHVEDLILSDDTRGLHLVHFFNVRQSVPHNAVLESQSFILTPEVIADDQVDCVYFEC